MKHPGPIRDFVMRGVVDMLEALRIRISMYHPDELGVLKVIERPQQFDVATDLCNRTMRALGHEVGEKTESRFNRTRRAMTKKHPENDRRGRRRGVLSPEDQAILSGQKEV